MTESTHPSTAGVEVMALHPGYLRGGAAQLSLVDHTTQTFPIPGARRHTSSSSSAEAPIVVGDVAIIPLQGVMSKSGYSGVSTAGVRQQLAELQDDDAIAGVLLWASTPGGHVAGTQELYEAIAAFPKPTHAHAEDILASAGFWAVAGAKVITVNKLAIVGSLGVYTYIDDVSVQYERAGIKTHLISTGPAKGAGTEGLPVSREYLEEMRETVQLMGNAFKDAVRAGRGKHVGDINALFSGRTWTPEAARALGLIDGVSTLSEALAGLQSAIRARKARRNLAREW